MCSTRIGVFSPRVSDPVVIVTAVLSELRIQGLGVIEDATLELHPGLTAVTGETGAGKTMVITGLHLLGGGRADSSRVRRGASRAVVEGRYVLPDPGAGPPGDRDTAGGDAAGDHEQQQRQRPRHRAA